MIETKAMPKKEVPLLFTAENRAAIRAGVKTETRRKFKLQSIKDLVGFDHNGFDYECRTPGQLWRQISFADLMEICPYGNPKERAVRYWVKEPVQVHGLYEDVMTSPPPWVELTYPDDGINLTAQTTEVTPKDAEKLSARKDLRRPTTAMHMLKSFTRTWLECLAVYPQRLRDITATAAIAEGIEIDPDVGVYGTSSDTDVASVRESFKGSRCWRDYLNGGYDLSPIQSFISLWDSIHGPGSWDPEQWVWVIKFSLEL